MTWRRRSDVEVRQSRNRHCTSSLERPEGCHMVRGIVVTAVSCLLTVSFAAAQAPSAKSPQASSPQVTVRPNATLTGCLYREEQVPGRKPNIVERAGVLEDYILADVTVARDPQQQPTGTAGSAS